MRFVWAGKSSSVPCLSTCLHLAVWGLSSESTRRCQRLVGITGALFIQIIHFRTGQAVLHWRCLAHREMQIYSQKPAANNDFVLLVNIPPSFRQPNELLYIRLNFVSGRTLHEWSCRRDNLSHFIKFQKNFMPVLRSRVARSETSS